MDDPFPSGVANWATERADDPIECSPLAPSPPRPRGDKKKPGGSGSTGSRGSGDATQVPGALPLSDATLVAKGLGLVGTGLDLVDTGIRNNARKRKRQKLKK